MNDREQFDYQSLSDIRRRAQKLGVKCTVRTFWRYYNLGMLPKGRKFPGYGNVLWFRPGTEIVLWWVEFLSTTVGIPLVNIADMFEAETDLESTMFEFYEAFPSRPNEKLRQLVKEQHDSLMRGFYKDFAQDFSLMLSREGNQSKKKQGRKKRKGKK